MRNLSATLLVLLVFVIACTPSNTPELPATQSLLDAAEAVTVTPAEKTQVPATATLQPTTAPTLTPTSLPVRYDLAGYRQFAVIRSYSQGLVDYYGERTISHISSSLSPDGKLTAISACWGSMASNWACETRNSGFLVVIDVDSGELLNDITLGNGWPGPMAFTPDGKYLLYSTEEYKIVLWDLTTNKPVRTLLDLPRSGTTIYPDVAVAPDGSSMSAVAIDTLYVWNPSGDLLLQVPAHNARASAALSYSADGSRLIVFSPDRTGMDIYTTSDWKLARSIGMQDIRDAEISPDGRFIAGIVPPDNTVVVWDTTSGEQLAELDPGMRANSLQFNPQGDLLIIAGMANLDSHDDYSTIGELYETQTWSRVDTLYSFFSEGQFRFNRDGSRMVVLGSYDNTLWELPDARLLAGFEVVQQFQDALAAGDYDTAASLFDASLGAADYLADVGFDANDLAGSFSLLCADEITFCHPVKELVMMGYDYETMTYLVRLEDPSGDVFTSPEGATIIYIYLDAGSGGQPKVVYPALE